MRFDIFFKVIFFLFNLQKMYIIEAAMLNGEKLLSSEIVGRSQRTLHSFIDKPAWE